MAYGGLPCRYTTLYSVPRPPYPWPLGNSLSEKRRTLRSTSKCFDNGLQVHDVPHPTSVGVSATTSLPVTFPTPSKRNGPPCRPRPSASACSSPPLRGGLTVALPSPGRRAVLLFACVGLLLYSIIKHLDRYAGERDRARRLALGCCHVPSVCAHQHPS